MTRAGAALGVLAALLSSGCRDTPPATSATEPQAVAAAPAEQQLESILRSDLSALQKPVREQLERELAALDVLLDDDSTPAAELSESFGLLGRLYHGYGLTDSAAPAYRNAARLAGSDYRWPYLLAVLAQVRGDRAEALDHLQRSHQLAPDDAPTTLRLAELRLTAGESEAAEKLFRRALNEDSQSAFAAYGLARIAAARNAHQTAVELFGQVLQLQPGANSVEYLLGQSYLRLGDRQAAERHVARRGEVPVSFDDPQVDSLGDLATGVGIHLERALKAYGTGRYEIALNEYRAALEFEPRNATALRGVALTLANAKRNDEALESYERMLEIYPQHQLARLEYGTVLLQKGRLKEAIDSFEDALRSDPDFKVAQFNRATAFAQLGEWQPAADGFREVLRIDRDDAEARYYLGLALDELDRRQEAVDELRTAIGANPSHLLARQRLGALLDRLDRPEEALEQFQAVLGLDVPPQEKGLAHYQIGRLLYTKGQDQEALENFQRAVELFPQFWQARFAVANWLSRHDRHREAAEIFGRLAQADPSNVLTWQRECEALMQDGRFAQARRRLEEGLATHTRSYELASVLARLLATAPEASLRDGERALQLAQELLTARRSIGQAETVAMALAELERYEEAVALQQQIIDWAESEGNTAAVAQLRRNLDRYRNRQPARQLPG